MSDDWQWPDGQRLFARDGAPAGVRFGDQGPERALPQAGTDNAGRTEARGDKSAEQVPGFLHLRSAALFLDPADAQTFADELFALHQRYQLKRGAKRYGMLLDLVPLDRPVDKRSEP